MDIHHIRYFLAVAGTLNFTRAASLCGVSQPALSRAIQQLEDEIGGLLFYRERALTQLTALGRLMEPRLRGVMDSMVGASIEARKFLTLDDPSIRLGVMCTIGPCRLASLFGNVQSQFPDVTVRLVEGTYGSLLDRLRSGEVDAAIMANPDANPVDLDAVTLYSERFLVAFPAGHRFEAMNAVPFSEVDRENYLRRLNCEYRDRLSALVRERGSALNICYQSEREDWILSMVAGGLGICFLPEFSATKPGVMTRPLIEPEVSREVAVMTRHGRTIPAALQALLAGMQDRIRHSAAGIPSPQLCETG